MTSVADPLSAGQEALARGDWVRAKEMFSAAVATDERAEALEGLGMAAWWLDDAESTFAARERAYQLFCEQHRRRDAARVATWLAWDYGAFRGERAVASGWLARAHRLLEGLEPAAEHGWLALREASMVLSSDAARARAVSAQAAALGRSLGIVDLEMTALALEGLAMVSEGAVEEGMRRLDEATAAALGGEMSDRTAISFTCCYLIFACERVRDYERAAQWCRRLSTYCDRVGIRPLFAICRAHYGAVLTLRGMWAEAEAELSAATDGLAETRPGQISEALVRLAELRRQQGRLEEAETLLDRAELHSLVALGRAAVALDRGDAAAGAEAAARFLRGLGGEGRIDRAAGLELLVRARVALGELEPAQSALDELSSIAESVGTDPLRASASFAAGVVAVAAGETEAARQAFEDAVQLFAAAGAPLEAARARLELADVLCGLHRIAPARREAQHALEAFQGLGAALEVERASALVAHLGAQAADRGQRAASDLTAREQQVLRLVADGLTNQEIAARLVVSEHTVHRHLANIFARLTVSSRAAAVARAAERGLL